jgi:ABC-type branched-subunit amino acid transport system ATPase component
VLLAPAGVAAAVWVLSAVNRGTTMREAADLVASVHERRFAQERADQGIPPPAVEVVALDFSYGTQPVLRQVSLAVEQGEVAALLGTNGAGKSTLLRVIAGLVAPERGIVRLFGEPAALLTTEELGRHGISLVLGGGMTFPGLTVADTVRLTGIGLPDPADVEEIYGRFPVLWHRRNQRTGTLSGGEQQMLALGRALLTRPRLMLIDELTLGLAPKIVGELVELVDEINEGGTTVVLVEQSVNIATGIAWHAFFLERGEIRYDGETHELLKRDDLLRSVFLAGAEK